MWLVLSGLRFQQMFSAEEEIYQSGVQPIQFAKPNRGQLNADNEKINNYFFRDHHFAFCAYRKLRKTEKSAR